MNISKEHTYKGKTYKIHISGLVYSISKCVLYDSDRDSDLDILINPPEPAVYYPDVESAERAMVKEAEDHIDKKYGGA